MANRLATTMRVTNTHESAMNTSTQAWDADCPRGLSGAPARGVTTGSSCILLRAPAGSEAAASAPAGVSRRRVLPKTSSCAAGQ
jgi:hypothetical protein